MAVTSQISESSERRRRRALRGADVASAPWGNWLDGASLDGALGLRGIVDRRGRRAARAAVLSSAARLGAAVPGGQGVGRRRPARDVDGRSPRWLLSLEELRLCARDRAGAGVRRAGASLLAAAPSSPPGLLGAGPVDLDVGAPARAGAGGVWRRALSALGAAATAGVADRFVVAALSWRGRRFVQHVARAAMGATPTEAEGPLSLALLIYVFVVAGSTVLALRKLEQQGGA